MQTKIADAIIDNIPMVIIIIVDTIVANDW